MTNRVQNSHHVSLLLCTNYYVNVFVLVKRKRRRRRDKTRLQQRDGAGRIKL